jgi:hypothetical protein
MRIDITPYLQRALEDIAQTPVDLSAVRAAIKLDFEPDDDLTLIIVRPQLDIAPDAAGYFREALRKAGLDDLKVFELARAFDKLARS